MSHLSIVYKISLFILALMGCDAIAAIPVDSITVSGRISGIPDDGRKSLIINECDFSEKSMRAFVELDSLGAFYKKLPYSSAHTFTINYNGEFVNAYAEPGDSIYFEIEASASPIVFHLSGDHASLNEEYSHAQNSLSDLYYSLSLPSPNTPLNIYLPEFKNTVKNTQKIIDEYVSANQLSDEVADMLRIHNLFTIANAAIDYSGANKDEKLAFFTDSIFDIYNDNNARMMIFPYHIGALCLSFPEIVKSTPKGTIRDLMYVALEEAPNREDFSNTAYYDRVFGNSAKAIDLSGIKQSDILVYHNGEVSTIENVEPIDWLVKTFSGKPIYLDVSATWCGPCRSSLSNSETLREHFKNRDVVFAVIWLKSDKDTWAQLAPTINNAIHIFIDNDDVSGALMSKLNLRGFPSSYFINRSGDFISDKVPFFHHPALYDFINAQLK